MGNHVDNCSDADKLHALNQKNTVVTGNGPALGSEQTDVQDDSMSFHVVDFVKDRLKRGFTASRNLLSISSKAVPQGGDPIRQSQIITPNPTHPVRQPTVLLTGPLLKYCSDTFKAGRPTGKQPQASFQRLKIDPMKFIMMKKTSITQDYIFLKTVGEGSFGKVYKAQLKSTGQNRAIKKIDKKSLDQAELMSIKNEFEMLKKLDHPCIIRLYDIYDSDNYLYVVTELCEGGSLLQFTNTQEISEPLLRTILDQLLGAVRYMHSFNILHRDLKLENVILVNKYKKGKDPLELKIIDFGTALDMSLDESKHAQIMGTPLYMPPEAFAADEINSLAWDMWSVGIMTMMMRTKQLPYAFKTQEQLIQKVKKTKFAPGIMKRMSHDLVIMVMSMLQEYPHDRLTAAASFGSKWMETCKPDSTCRKARAKTIVNLQAYQVGNNLVSIIESFLVSRKVCQEQRQNLAEIFKSIDTDRSGIIEIDELRKFYSANCQSGEMEEGEVDLILKEVDKNQSGKIDFNEFITAMYNRRKLFQIKHLQEAFDFVDTDHSGWISRQEILDLLQGGALQEINHLFKQLDNDSDNKISKREFIQYLRDGDY